MTRRSLRLLRLPIMATVALAVLLVSIPGREELFLHMYLIAVASVALGTLVGHVRRTNPVAAKSAFDLALERRPPRPERLADLERIERELTLAGQTAADFYFRLRPRLRRIAARLLAARRGIDLDGSPAAARRALGDELWELVRADREPPRRRDAAGLSVPEAERIVTALEAL